MLPGIIGLVLRFAPDLATAFLGDKAGGAVETVTQIVRSVAGTDDPAALEAKLAGDPKLAEVLVERLREETKRYLAEVEDTASARAQALALVRSGSAMAWGPVLVSVLVTLGFLAAVYGVFTVPLTDMTGQVALVLLGTLAGGFTQVLNYWLGSSAGSRAKDDAFKALINAATPSLGKATAAMITRRR